MFNAADELMFRFADELKHLTPEDDIPIYVEEPLDYKERPLDIPVKENISDLLKLYPKHTPTKERVGDEGSPEWMAKNHPREFLRGTKQPYRGYVCNPKYAGLVKEVMERLLVNTPELYFDWGLDRIDLLRWEWLIPASIALMKKDPISALTKRIYEHKEFIGAGLLGELWKRVIDASIDSSSQSPQGKDFFSGELGNRMRHLAGFIAANDSAFYNLYIAGKSKLTNWQNDQTAKHITNK